MHTFWSIMIFFSGVLAGILGLIVGYSTGTGALIIISIFCFCVSVVLFVDPDLQYN